jgi:AraC-like DNA-binding protein
VLVQRGASGLTRYFKLTPRTLRRVCAKKGVSLCEFRAVLIVADATALLCSGLPVKEVARRLGFSSSQRFARFLRREYGMTAGQLRFKSVITPAGAAHPVDRSPSTIRRAGRDTPRS